MRDDAPPPQTPRARRVSRVRFTIRGLMMACFYAAFALAAVLRPSMLAANFLQATLACLVVAAAVLGIVGGRPGRAFCLGFATLGFAYLAVAWLSRDGSPTLMATSRLVHRLLPGDLALQDHPAFYLSCAAIENAVYATLGGTMASLLALGLRRRSRSCPMFRASLDEHEAAASHEFP